MDQFSNNRNAISSTWDTSNIQSFDNLKPITSQIESGDRTPKRDGFSPHHSEVESPDCCNSMIKCSQETSFSGHTIAKGLHYRGLINNIFFNISA